MIQNLERNTRKSFIISIYTLICLVISIVIIILANKFQWPAFAVGGPFLITLLLGSIGWVYSLKSIKEKNTIQKIVSIIFTSVLVLWLIAFILGDLAT